MIETDKKLNTMLSLAYWHFGSALKQILIAWKNFLVFNFRYFSITLLLKTLFSHWRKYKTSYGRGFDAKTYARAFLENMISRILGAIIRIVIIIFGLIIEILIFFVGIFVFLFWLLMPFFVLFGLYAGIVMLI